MFPLATAAGNTMVLKPSERDPTAAMMLAKLAVDVGFPKGVLNVIHGAHVRFFFFPPFFTHPASTPHNRTRSTSSATTPTSRPSRLSAATRPAVTSLLAQPPPASASRRTRPPRTTPSSCPTPTRSRRSTSSSAPRLVPPDNAAWPSRSPSLSGRPRSGCQSSSS